jgi:hypothetical protein
MSQLGNVPQFKRHSYDLVTMGSFSPIAAKTAGWRKHQWFGSHLSAISGRQRTVGIIIGPKAARRVVKSTETYYISMLFRMRLSRFCHLLIPTETKKNNSTLRTRHFHRISFLILITLLHFSTATYHREAQELAETKKHSTLHVPHCPTVYRHWKLQASVGIYWIIMGWWEMFHCHTLWIFVFWGFGQGYFDGS